MELFILIIEIIGTVAFAVSGALVGIRKNYGICGVTALGLVTAVGGAIIRDLILGIIPSVIFTTPVFVVTAIIVSILVFFTFTSRFFCKNTAFYDCLMLIFDSIGLSIFTVIGVETALTVLPATPVLPIILVGVIAGVSGGVLRDILANEAPALLVQRGYACASVVGAVVCALLVGVTGLTAAIILGAVSIFVIRLLSVRLCLPTAE